MIVDLQCKLFRYQMSISDAQLSSRFQHKQYQSDIILPNSKQYIILVCIDDARTN